MMSSKNNKFNINATKEDMIFNIVNYSILSVIFVLVFYPLIYVISSSFSSPSAVMSGKVILWPVEPTLDGYKAVFQSKQVWVGYINSIIYAIAGTAINLVLTIMAAYPLSRKDFRGRNVIMLLFVFTMFFNGGLIPTYLLVKQIGILNTRWAMLLPKAMMVWNVIIAKTYFQSSIPDELLEASQIDGCSNRRFILSILLPLSMPIIAVIALFCIVNIWNTYFDALLYLQNEKLYPLQIFLRNILIQNQTDNSMMTDIAGQERREQLEALLRYSLIIVASLPVLAIYPFVQKHFVKGVMIGAIKG